MSHRPRTLANVQRQARLKADPSLIPPALFLRQEGLDHAQKHYVSPRCVRFTLVLASLAVGVMLLILLPLYLSQQLFVSK